ncbi:hypothetical protein MD484_g3014, partial [Candolleomyces efflorescens]
MGSSDYSADSDSGGSSYSFGGKKKDKKDKKDKKEKKDKDKKDKDKEKEKKDKKDHKDKDGKDKDKKDKKDKDEKEHKDKDKKDKDKKDKDKKDKDKKDKKDKDKYHDDKPSTSYAAPSYPTIAGSSGHGTSHGVPSFPSFPSAAGGYHNTALGISHPSPLPPPSGPTPTAIPKTMSFDAPPSGYRVPLDSNDPSQSFSLETSGPPVSYDLDGSPIFIGSVLLENAVHPCKIGPHLDPPAQVAYGGGEIGHHGRYDLLPFVPDQMEWVLTGYGQIPPGRTPVEGGYEEGGEKLYHALAVINDVKVPGKTGEHLAGANVGFGGAEHSVPEGYEILCWKY